MPVYAGVVIIGTLSRFNFSANIRKNIASREEPIEWVPFSYICPKCGFDFKGKILNLCMLFPFGSLFAVRFRRHMADSKLIYIATLAGFFFSLSIETLQFFRPSRQPSTSDLVLNTMGAFFGAMAVVSLLRARRRLGIGKGL
jgi:glycopeptide antibiotics resistance protein